MHSFTTTAAWLLMVASASAHPIKWSQPGKARTPAGAAYVISNEASSNMIIASNIAADGSLTFGSAISTGGRGLHGATADASTPDGLFSQGAIEVSGNNVFTVNPGSNTASMFSINPSNPSKLTMVGSPVSTGGEFPMSLTISKATGQVCVLNGGAVANVNCFTPDPKLGLVTMENSIRPFGLNQTTPPSGPAGTTSHILFNDAGDKLTASIKGLPPTPGFLATWDVDANGALSANFTQSTPAAGGLLPFGMTNIPGKNAIINADAGVGFVVYDFSQEPATSTVVPIDGQMATCWTSFSNATKSFFLTDAGTSVITEVAVDQNLNGTIIKQYPQAANSTTLDSSVGTVGGKDFLYVLSAGKTTINVLSLPAQGQATKLQDFNVAQAAKGVTVSPANIQGMALYIKQ